MLFSLIFLLITGHIPMGKTEVSSLDTKHQLTIDTNNEDQFHQISYVKKGYGPQVTDRPLGAIRLELAMEEAKITQLELATKVGVLQPTISRILDGTTKRSRYLPSIAKVLNKNINWLAGIEPDDKNNALVNNNLLDINSHLFMLIPQYKNKDELTDQSISESIKTEDFIIIAKDQIPSSIDPSGLRYIHEPERAMMPVIKTGATVTFDTQDTSVTSGDISVIEFGNTICARFLFSQPNGDILIRAKEDDFPDYTVRNGEDNFKILGRVIFVTNRF